MKVKELIKMLSDIPLEADIYVDNDGETFGTIAIGPITTSHEDDTIIGYLIFDDKQLDLPLDKERVN